MNKVSKKNFRGAKNSLKLDEDSFYCAKNL